MLTRFRRGLNFVGMLSHVFLPIITAFEASGGAFDVTRAKYAISLDSRQGSCEFWPMPLDLVAATMMVRRDIDKYANRKMQDDSKGDKTCFKKTSVPFLPFRPRRRFDLHFALLDLVPIGTQGGAATLLVTLHHSLFGVFVRVSKDFLEERVESAISPDVGIFLRALLLLGGQYFSGDALPVLLGLDRGGRGGGGGRGRRSGVGQG